MSVISLHEHSGQQALAIFEKIAGLYGEIHAADTDPMYSYASFASRTQSQVRAPGFKLVTADDGDILAGFSFGYPFPAGTWWAECTPAPPGILGTAKFAVIELDVREEYRGRGLSRRLLGELLAERSERYATLAAIPDGLAYSMYLRWDWYKAGTFSGDPAMDALVLPLHQPAPGARPASS